MVEIMMPLLDEGTDVWRPVIAESLGGQLFRICGPMPEDELWKFRPGEVVQGENRTFYGGQRALTAVTSVPEPRPVDPPPA
jgi:hypothetical protein